MKKRIAVIGIKGLPSKGGAERVVEALVEKLRPDFDISVYCQRSYSGDYRSDSVRLIKLRTFGGKHLAPFSLFILSALHALFAGKYDLIHVHNTDAGFILPLLRLRYRVVATSHGSPYKREKWHPLVKSLLKRSESLFMRFASVRTCVSRSITEELISTYKKDVSFIPNGISPLSPADVTPLLQSHGLQPGQYLCFAAGRMDPTKGCHIFLDALGRLENPPDAVVIGDYSHKPDYSGQLFSRAGDTVRFIPFIAERSTLFGLVEKAKLFVFPSTVEAMSVMLLEVAALGVPVICSDIPENMCVLEDKTVYFRSEDDKDLAAKIDSSLLNYPVILEGARRTRQWVLQRYDWKSISIEYKNLYNSV